MSTPQQKEQQKKRIAIAVFGLVFLGAAIYVYETDFASNGPAPQQAPVVVTKPSEGVARGGSAQSGTPGASVGAAPGVAATKMANTSSSLDPTLDERAMLRTESLVYTGTGRNIFSLVYVPPAPKVIGPVPSARPNAGSGSQAAVPSGPPPLPPINLKFFGTEVGSDGKKQAFLLHEEDVYLASEGDIVARRYKIRSIGTNSVQVEDLLNGNTQSVPLQAN